MTVTLLSKYVSAVYFLQLLIFFKLILATSCRQFLVFIQSSRKRWARAKYVENSIPAKGPPFMLMLPYNTRYRNTAHGNTGTRRLLVLLRKTCKCIFFFFFEVCCSFYVIIHSFQVPETNIFNPVFPDWAFSYFCQF